MSERNTPGSRTTVLGEFSSRLGPLYSDGPTPPRCTVPVTAVGLGSVGSRATRVGPLSLGRPECHTLVDLWSEEPLGRSPAQGGPPVNGGGGVVVSDGASRDVRASARSLRTRVASGPSFHPRLGRTSVSTTLKSLGSLEPRRVGAGTSQGKCVGFRVWIRRYIGSRSLQNARKSFCDRRIMSNT